METAAVIVAILLGGVALFQLALAGGARWGDHAYGGRVTTDGGRLPPRYRVMSAAAIPLLGLSAWIVMARAGALTDGGSRGGWVAVAVWVVFGYLVVNTIGNVASPSKIERFGMGAVTVVAAVATLIVAVSA